MTRPRASLVSWENAVPEPSTVPLVVAFTVGTIGYMWRQGRRSRA